jgi:hypothetical protein
LRDPSLIDYLVPLNSFERSRELSKAARAAFNEVAVKYCALGLFRGEDCLADSLQ